MINKAIYYKFRYFPVQTNTALITLYEIYSKGSKRRTMKDENSRNMFDGINKERKSF